MTTEVERYEAVLRELRALRGMLGRPAAELFTPVETAKRLRVSPTQLARIKALGLITTVPMGDSWRVSSREIERICEEGVPSLTAPPSKEGATGSKGAEAVLAALKKKRKG